VCVCVCVLTPGTAQDAQEPMGKCCDGVWTPSARPPRPPTLPSTASPTEAARPLPHGPRNVTGPRAP
jgi:hypothetical protein